MSEDPFSNSSMSPIFKDDSGSGTNVLHEAVEAPQPSQPTTTTPKRNDTLTRLFLPNIAKMAQWKPARVAKGGHTQPPPYLAETATSKFPVPPSHAPTVSQPEVTTPIVRENSNSSLFSGSESISNTDEPTTLTFVFNLTSLTDYRPTTKQDASFEQSNDSLDDDAAGLGVCVTFIFHLMVLGRTRIGPQKRDLKSAGAQLPSRPSHQNHDSLL